MRRFLAAMTLAAVAMSASPGLAQEQLRPGAKGDDQVMGFSPEDQAMNRAIAEARRTLPVWWAAVRAGQGERYTLKVEIPGREASEHIWVANVARDGARFTGTLENEPYDIPNLHRGDRVSFDEAQISDWSYVKDGRLWGAFTTRVMVDHMSPEEQEEWRQMLSPTPIEGRAI